MSTTQTIQILSITTALLASGSIATLSLFATPLLQSQPASRSLRWLFSRGSHIFPTSALLSSSGFAYLAYTSLPTHATHSLFTHATTGKSGLYLAASALAFSCYDHGYCLSEQLCIFSPEQGLGLLSPRHILRTHQQDCDDEQYQFSILKIYRVDGWKHP